VYVRPILTLAPLRCVPPPPTHIHTHRLGLSEQWSDVDWSNLVVPGGSVSIFGQRPEYGSAAFPESEFTTPVRTPAWMQEAEIKHGRLAMLAVVGWIAVDLGVRMPGSGYDSIANSFVAHNAAVANGSLSWLAMIAAAVELVNGVSLYEQGKGSGRIPGDFKFDPCEIEPTLHVFVCMVCVYDPFSHLLLYSGAAPSLPLQVGLRQGRQEPGPLPGQ
jgi:Chlorophyll A-B binding protein